MPCSGNANEACGGPDRLNVFLDNAVPPPVTVQIVNGTQGDLWTYQGCFTSVFFLSRVFLLSPLIQIIDIPVVMRYLREPWVTRQIFRLEQRPSLVLLYVKLRVGLRMLD